MKQLMLTFGLCLLVFFCQAQNAWLIVPGKSIGQVKLEWPRDSLSVLGKPDAGDAAMMKSWNIWYGRKGDKSVDSAHILAVFTAMRVADTQYVKQIRITSSMFKTDKNVGVGSSIATIKKAYPNLRLSKIYASANKKRRIAVYEDKQSGIAFETKNPRSRSAACTTVVVFDPGESAAALLDYHVGFDNMEPVTK